MIIVILFFMYIKYFIFNILGMVYFEVIFVFIDVDIVVFVYLILERYF